MKAQLTVIQIFTKAFQNKALKSLSMEILSAKQKLKES